MAEKNQLTAKEKIRLLVADDCFTVGGSGGKTQRISVTDGPCGLRKGGEGFPQGVPAICYPAPQVIANSWDREVARKTGEAIASDCIDAGEDIILAPGINIKRTPLCGRNFEYFSEDPYLTGELAAEYIDGCQSKGIGVSLKHFCANNREWDRLSGSSEVDLRTLREMYTRAFEIVIERSKPWTIMCAYNRVNGEYCSQNEWLLKGILRDALGYDGVIISDWGAVHDRVASLKASLDIMFPGENWATEQLVAAYENGEITDELIDASAERVLALGEKVRRGKADGLRVPLDVKTRRTIACEGAEKGCVLLKNDGVLPFKNPLKADKLKIALLGKACEMPLYTGGGSAGAFAKNVPETLYDELGRCLPDAEIVYRGVYEIGSSTNTPGRTQIVNIRDALTAAYDSDVTVLVVGNNRIDETECYDRDSLKLDPRQEQLIAAVAEKANKLVVIVEAGSAVDMTAWIDSADAVLFAGFGGECINVALARVLSGEVCPSGRLSETFPLSLDDTPTGRTVGNGFAERYSEGVFVGYRWYDTKKKPVLFPFGYGLSYAAFEYSDFLLEEGGGDGELYRLSLTVKNTSERDGGEVVQVYVGEVDAAVERPEKELCRFEKVYLKAGEEKRLTFRLGEDCFAHFDVLTNAWKADREQKFVTLFGGADTTDFGRYRVYVGKNCRDVVWERRIKLR